MKLKSRQQIEWSILTGLLVILFVVLGNGLSTSSGESAQTVTDEGNMQQRAGVKPKWLSTPIQQAAINPGQPKLEFVMEERDKPDILRGLQGVYFILTVAKQTEQGIQQDKPTAETLKTDSELQLRQYGIGLLSNDEWLHTRFAAPALVVVVEISKDLEFVEGVPFVLADINVGLLEPVVLARDGTRGCCASTWEKRARTAETDHNFQEIRQQVKDLVAKFINDYLAANPKESATARSGTRLDQTEPTGGNKLQ